MPAKRDPGCLHYSLEANTHYFIIVCTEYAVRHAVTMRRVAFLHSAQRRRAAESTTNKKTTLVEILKFPVMDEEVLQVQVRLSFINELFIRCTSKVLNFISN